jgi:hypothetical protein
MQFFRPSLSIAAFKSSLLLVLGASLAAATSARATTIGTENQWQGEVVNTFGGGATETYGETIIAPTESTLLDFTFYVYSLDGLPADVEGQVYAWTGNLEAGNDPQGATGPALFSESLTIEPGSDFEAVTVDTGDLQLTAGNAYILLLTDPSDTGGDFEFEVVGAHPWRAGRGGFNYFNNSDPAQINNGDWSASDDANDYGDLAFTADFASPTPEPSSLILLATGLLGAAGAIRRKAMA